ncbi:MAG: phytanoyl-CoA dioxygenase family protein [Gemmatimonadota bacterium]
MLAPGEIAAFLADGYIALRGAVPAGVAGACQDAVWAVLEQRGVRRGDPGTWTAPVVRIDCPEGGPFAEAGTSPAVWEACDQLIGAGRWWRRAGVGGTIPVRFPGEADPGDAGWHIESSYEAGGEWRVNLRSRARGLLALYLFTDVDAASAPTRVRPGSHLDVPPILAPASDAGLAWLPAAQQAAQASAHRRTELVTGQAGDVFLCHPFLVHAASWPHRGARPRMIAQPGVALHTEFPLGAPGEPVSPVEQAILAGLANVSDLPAPGAGPGR